MKTQANLKSISVQELKGLIDDGESLQIIDVREAPEFALEKLTQSTFAPLSNFAESEKKIDKSRRSYLLCKSGGRAKQFAEKLIQSGYNDVTIIEGGISAWMSSGYPVEKGQSKVWALERQVRVAAGSFVLIGALLSHFVHPAWIGLSGFVGAGLIFAGVTDTCGMGLLLAKMPWNQANACSV